MGIDKEKYREEVYATAKAIAAGRHEMNPELDPYLLERIAYMSADIAMAVVEKRLSLPDIRLTDNKD